MSKFSDRIREAIWNLRQVPGFKPNEQYDHRIHQPISEAIDLLKDLMVTQLTMRASPEQIRALQELMEGGLGEYQIIAEEDVDKLVKGITEDGPAMKALKQGTPVFGGAARVNVPVEQQPEKMLNVERGLDGLLYTRGMTPYLDDNGRLIHPGNPIPESNQQEQPREETHCTAHTTYAPEQALPERTPEPPEEVTHHPV